MIEMPPLYLPVAERLARLRDELLEAAHEAEGDAVNGGARLDEIRATAEALGLGWPL